MAAFCLLVLLGLLPTGLKTQQSGIQQTTANQIISQISSFCARMSDCLQGKLQRLAPILPIRMICDWSNLNGHWRDVATPDTMYFTNEGKQTGTVTAIAGKRCLQGKDHVHGAATGNHFTGKYSCYLACSSRS